MLRADAIRYWTRSADCPFAAHKYWKGRLEQQLRFEHQLKLHSSVQVAARTASHCGWPSERSRRQQCCKHLMPLLLAVGCRLSIPMSSQCQCFAHLHLLRLSLSLSLSVPLFSHLPDFIFCVSRKTARKQRLLEAGETNGQSATETAAHLST